VNCTIGQRDVQGANIGVGVDRHCANVAFTARADDANRNLAAVGDEDPCEHQPWPESIQRALRFSRNARIPS
jgi:hypothetical protein